MPDRVVRAAYTDPVSLIWLSTAARLGLVVRRTNEVFASFDGRQTLSLGTPETLDPDDCIAQMVFHELCHWITHGHDAIHEIDWGFAASEEEDWREYAALRLQASLADARGLRTFFAPTTDARSYFDRLGADPLAPLEASTGEDRITRLAQQARQRAESSPWCPHIQEALEATAQIARIVAPYAQDVQPTESLPSLWPA